MPRRTPKKKPEGDLYIVTDLEGEPQGVVGDLTNALDDLQGEISYRGSDDSLRLYRLTQVDFEVETKVAIRERKQPRVKK